MRNILAKIAHILTILLIVGIGVQTFTSCGSHSFEDVFGSSSSMKDEKGYSSSSEISSSGSELEGSSPSEISSSSLTPSSSSLTPGRSSSGGTTDDSDFYGVDPKDITETTTSDYITNSQGTVIVGPLLKS